MYVGATEGAAMEIRDADQRICGICEAMVSRRGLLDCCDHMFCFACIEDWATVTNLCPMCKKQFKLLSLVTTGEATAGESEGSSTQERRSDEEFSYFIDEEAVSCLDGNDCKLRAGQHDLEDTSVACDGCDRWYHACCVDFDPSKPCGKTWLCPRCAFPAGTVAPKEQKDIEETASTSFSFTETGESAIVISMVNSNENEKEDKVQAQPQPLPVSGSQQQTSLDKLLDGLAKQGSKGSMLDESLEDVEEEPQDPAESDFEEELDPEEEQRIEDEVQEIFKEAAEEQDDMFVEEDEEVAEQHEQEDYSDMELPSRGPEDMEPNVEPGLAIEELVSDGEDEKQSYQETDVVVDDPETGKLKELQIVQSQPSSQPVQNETKTDGVRTRIIMRRETDEASLAEKIRQQVMETTESSDISNDRLLAAYKAALVQKPASKPTKAPLDSAREKLKLKLYGGLRGRRIYDRDWDVAFWRQKVLGEKRRLEQQVREEEKASITSVEAADEASDSIKDRLCLADCSLLPKVDGANPLPVPVETPKPKSSDKSSWVKLNPKPDPKTSEAKEDKDKRKWALELLARKNKQQSRPQHDGLKGNFLLLPQLPIDMRPVLEPNPRSKVPTAVRQMHLNRFLELYLKNVATVGRNEESLAAVDAARAKEKEMSDKANSKGVYVNLCVRALARGEAPVKEVSTPQLSVSEALLATGLVSDSPPGSPEPGPSQQQEKFEVERQESPRKKVKFEADSSADHTLFEKKGLNALLEHLRKEEPVVEAAAPSTTSDSNGKAEQGKDLEEAADLEKRGPSPGGNDDLGKQEEKPAETMEEKQEEKQQEKQEKRRENKLASLKRRETNRPPDDLAGKFMDLESRMDRVRSNIAQHLSENGGIAQQMREENPDMAEQRHSDRSKRPPSKAHDHSRKPASSHHKTAPPPQVVAKPDAGKSSTPSVQQQVEMYIKEHIRPLHKSGVIKTEQYQWTVSKTTTKVLQFHKDATSADFLITEGGRVKKLAEQYLQRFAQEKQAENPGR